MSVEDLKIAQFAKAFGNTFGLNDKLEDVKAAIAAYLDSKDYTHLVDGTAIVDAWLLWGEAEQNLLGQNISVPSLMEAKKSELPDMCFSYVSSFAPGKNVVAIKRGERGCFSTTHDEAHPEKAKALVEHLNNKLGVTPEQAECMSIGSMFGWDCPGAQLSEVVVAPKSIDRLHALTELQPEIPKLPDMSSGEVSKEAILAWVSNPQVLHYLKRIEEAMPDLLEAANQFVEYASDQEVSGRLIGAAGVSREKRATESLDSEKRAVSKSTAELVASSKGTYKYPSTKVDHIAEGKAMFVSDFHVVMNLGRSAAIYSTPELNLPSKLDVLDDLAVAFKDGVGHSSVGKAVAQGVER